MINVVERTENNAPALDEMNLEEAVAMHEMGCDFECEDGKIARIIERKNW